MVTQLGVLSPGAPPGRPDMRTTVPTPSSEARSTVAWTSPSISCPMTGWSWFPLMLRALMRRPRSAMAPVNRSRAAASASRPRTSQWGAEDQPPVGSSIVAIPSPAAVSSISSKGREARESVTSPSSMAQSSSPRTDSMEGTRRRAPSSFMERTRVSATIVVRRESLAVAASSGMVPLREASTQAASSAR